VLQPLRQLPPLPMNDGDAWSALRCLGSSPRPVLELLSCLLAERKLLFHSTDLSRIAPLAEVVDWSMWS
jgi:hypothetical protein